MIVICGFELVLYDDSLAVLVFGNKIDLKVTGEKFPLRVREGNPNGLRQDFEIGFEPSRKPSLLVLPQLAEGNPL